MGYGMTILPDEVGLFPKAAVSPVLAVGYDPSSKSPRKVVFFQIDTEVCPLYDERTKGCSVHSSKPLTCRAYPGAVVLLQSLMLRPCRTVRAGRPTRDMLIAVQSIDSYWASFLPDRDSVSEGMWLHLGDRWHPLPSGWEALLAEVEAEIAVFDGALKRTE